MNTNNVNLQITLSSPPTDPSKWNKCVRRLQNPLDREMVLVLEWQMEGGSRLPILVDG